jgi:hypothetical protein
MTFTPTQLTDGIHHGSTCSLGNQQHASTVIIDHRTLKIMQGATVSNPSINQCEINKPSKRKTMACFSNLVAARSTPKAVETEN